MGTYKRIRIIPNEKSLTKRNKIREVFRDYEAEDCFKQFSASTKWWPDDLIYKLREKFPSTMFKVTMSAEDFFTEYYVFDGKIVEEEYLDQKFPSPKEFSNGFKKKSASIREVAKRKERDKRERLQKEVSETKAKLEKLESALEEHVKH